MAASVTFRDFTPGDAVQLALQPSQHLTLGLTRPVLSYADGEELAAGGPAWTALADGRVIACFGATTLWPANGAFRGHAVAWALLAEGIGAAHLALTRYVREKVETLDVSRLEAIVRCDVAAEACWAKLCGLRRRHLLRQWGPEGKPHILYARVNG